MLVGSKFSSNKKCGETFPLSEYTGQHCSRWSSGFHWTGLLNSSQPVDRLLFICSGHKWIEICLVPTETAEFWSIYDHLYKKIPQSEKTAHCV